MFNYLFFLTAGKEVMNAVPSDLNPVADGETVRNSLFF